MYTKETQAIYEYWEREKNTQKKICASKFQVPKQCTMKYLQLRPSSQIDCADMWRQGGRASYRYFYGEKEKLFVHGRGLTQMFEPMTSFAMVVAVVVKRKLNAKRRRRACYSR